MEVEGGDWEEDEEGGNAQDDDMKLRPPFSPNKKKAYILTRFFITKNVKNDQTFFTLFSKKILI